MKPLPVAIAAMLLGAAPAAAESARYKVTFEGTWSAATHPFEYPAGAHFSGPIGATHNASYAVFADGGVATPGLERLAEMGAHRPLDAEIRSAISAERRERSSRASRFSARQGQHQLSSRSMSVIRSSPWRP
jgi:hypothetical protein